MQNLGSRLVMLAVMCGVPAFAIAAPPAAPTVTVGASFKQLRFDVEPVPGASYFQLWFLANGNAQWVEYMETTAATPVFKVTVSAHLLDWFNARYRVAACNSSGCTSNTKFAVTSHMTETVGYIKPRASAADPHLFGSSPKLSADGKTLAVISGETIGPRTSSAVVIVYRKGASGWQREARLVPSPVESNTGGGDSKNLSINRDGTLIALGLPSEFSLAPGNRTIGGAYLFRKTGTTWALEKKFAPDPDKSWKYGQVVALDDAGQTFAVWRSYIDEPQEDPYASQQGAIEIFRHGTGGWASAQVIPIDIRVSSCEAFALSGDGLILARSCERFAQIFEGSAFALRQTIDHGGGASAIETNYDGSLIVAASPVTTPAPAGATWTPRVTVYRRGSAGWQADPAFTHVGNAPKPPSNGYDTDSSPTVLAISRDGRFVAVGDYGNQNGGTGAVHGPLTKTSQYTGAFFIYERKPTAWALRSMIKSNVLSDQSWFGYGISFGDDGKSLAVGQPLEDSGARDIDGDQTNTSSPDSGAVWLY